MLLQILDILAPIFAIVGLGALWGFSGRAYEAAFARDLALLIGGPCLVFVSLARLDLGEVDLLAISAAALLVYALMGAATLAVLAVAGLSARVFWAPLTFGNGGNLGLPLALFAFGEPGLAIAVVIFAMLSVLMLSLGVWAASGEASPKAVLTEPIVYAAVLGVLWASMDWPLPQMAARSFELVGQLTIPIMLMTLGYSISRLSVRSFPLAVALSLAKLALGALAGVAAAEIMGLEGAARGVLILIALAPVAVTSYLIADKFGADSDQVAALVLVSTIVSLGALPVALTLLLA